MKLNLSLVGHQLYPGERNHWFDGITPHEMVRVAQRADALGFDQLRISEHVVIPREWVATMGPRWLDCLATMSYIAAATERIRVSSAIIVVPYHHPLMLAKALATIDHLSGGRVDFAAGVGYMEREFELLGADFAARGAVTDESLDAIVELWTSEDPAYDGQHVAFRDVVLDPKPDQRPHPPIWIGGYTNASIRRAARVGDGWMPWGVTRAQLPAKLDQLRNDPGFTERPRPFGVFLDLFDRDMDPSTHAVVAPARITLERDAIVEQLHQLAALGVTMTCVDPLLGYGHYGGELTPIRDLEEYLDRLEWIAAEIVPEAARICAA